MRRLPGALLLCFLSSPPGVFGASYRLRSSHAPPPPETAAWFSALDALLDGYEGAVNGLVRGAVERDAGELKKSAGLVARMAEEYRRITGDSAGAKKAREAAESAAGRIAGKKLPDARDLAAAATLDKGAVLRWAQLMRQRALEHPGPDGKFPANSLLSYEENGTSREFAFLSVSTAVPSAALDALAAALAEIGDRDASAVAGGKRLWLRSGEMTLFLDTASAFADGTLRVRYAEKDVSHEGQARFYFLTKTLIEGGFAVGVGNGELTGVLGGESVRLDSYGRLERFVYAWKAHETARALRPHLGDLLKETVSQSENSSRLDELAAVFRAEGALPFLDGEGRASTRLEAYRRRHGDREALRSDLNARLAALGLPLYPSAERVGQRGIDLFFNDPLSAALSRGELQYREGKLARKKGFDPLAEALGQGLRDVWDEAEASELIGIAGERFVLRLQRRSSGGVWETAYLRGGSPAKGAGGYEFDARVLSGAGGPARGTVTYDPAKAGAGMVFVTPYLSPKDAPAAAASDGVVTTEGGYLSALACAAAGKTAMNVQGGVWGFSSGLRLSLPVFGPPRSLAGRRVRSVLRRDELILREGDKVRLDPRRAVVEVIE